MEMLSFGISQSLRQQIRTSSLEELWEVEKDGSWPEFNIPKVPDPSGSFRPSPCEHGPSPGAEGGLAGFKEEPGVQAEES